MINNLISAVENSKAASAWDKGVKAYALDLLAELPDNVDYGSVESLKADLLNGARNWKEYSECGFSLIYDEDIAKRLCTPSELKKTDNGMKRPNARENWIDVQARALWQAFDIIRHAYYQLYKKEA